MVALGNVGAPRVVCSLPPKPVEDGRERPNGGGGLGRGVPVRCASSTIRRTPTPNPSPQGGGKQTARVAPFPPTAITHLRMVLQSVFADKQMRRATT